MVSLDGGAIDEHIELLEIAKLASGLYGKLIVAIEGKKSILARAEDKRIVILEDKSRLKKISAIQFVDYCFILDPQLSEPKALAEYYYMAKEKLHPNIVVTGAEKYYLRELFEQEARKIGFILLWNKAEEEETTSELEKMLNWTGTYN